jgi:hypothetical protein
VKSTRYFFARDKVCHGHRSGARIEKNFQASTGRHLLNKFVSFIAVCDSAPRVVIEHLGSCASQRSDWF